MATDRGVLYGKREIEITISINYLSFKATILMQMII